MPPSACSKRCGLTQGFMHSLLLFASLRARMLFNSCEASVRDVNLLSLSLMAYPDTKSPEHSYRSTTRYLVATLASTCCHHGDDHSKFAQKNEEIVRQVT